jgi:predicted ATPase
VHPKRDRVETVTISRPKLDKSEENTMPSGIDRIEVRGFKSFVDVTVKLRPLNVLIGANAAGKSNFLTLFKMLNAITDQRLQSFVAEQGYSDAILHLGLKHTSKMEISLYGNSDTGINSYYAQLTSVAPGKLIFADEKLSYQPTGKKTTSYDLFGGHEETRLPATIDSGGYSSDVAKFIKYRLERWRFYHFHDTSAQSQIKQPAQLHDNKFLASDAGNLASFLYMLRASHPWHYKEIRDAVRLVYSNFDDFSLEPSRLNEKTIFLSWREKGSSYEFGPHQGSDGSLRFMCLATLLLQPFEHKLAPHTITIDEPELGLHPYAISLLAEIISKASRQVQIIVSTQSAALLSAIDDPESALVVHRNGGSSSIRRLSPDELSPWLDNYSLGDLWEKGVLTGGGPQG